MWQNLQLLWHEPKDDSLANYHLPEMPKRTHSKLPAAYVPLLILATVISIATALINSIELLIIATWVSAAVGLYLLVGDTMKMLGGVVFIGRLVVNFGIFYWFWLGAWQASA